MTRSSLSVLNVYCDRSAPFTTFCHLDLHRPHMGISSWAMSSDDPVQQPHHLNFNEKSISVSANFCTGKKVSSAVIAHERDGMQKFFAYISHLQAMTQPFTGILVSLIYTGLGDASSGCPRHSLGGDRTCRSGGAAAVEGT